MAVSKKVALTDRFLKALKPAPTGKREMFWDALQPHLAVRVTDRGRCSFVVVKRRTGDVRPTRYYLGTYPVLSLAEARAAAPKVLSALIGGNDPKELEKERVRDERLKYGTTFEAVAEEFIARHVSKLKSRRSTELVIKKELLGLSLKRVRADGRWIDEWRCGPDSRWRERPIAKINRRDVVELLEQICDGGSRYQARKVFAILGKLFNWILLRDVYGVEVSPITRLRHTDILGSFPPRSRVLSDDELRLIWSASKELAYPFGTLVQMLLLSGQRLRELSNARWSEVSQNVLVIPAARMKGKIAHSVPLTDHMAEILAGIPDFRSGTTRDADVYVFSTTCGRRPLGGFSKMKQRLDKTMVEIARRSTGAPTAMIPHWTLHDLRRTVRTRLSGLGVLPLVAELVIGHKQTGIQAVYDLHTYQKEKQDALNRWETELLKIIEGQKSGTNVVKFVSKGCAKRIGDV